jgi:hypothetical protein
VVANGYEKSILTINRMVPGPSIQVCNIFSPWFAYDDIIQMEPTTLHAEAANTLRRTTQFSFPDGDGNVVAQFGNDISASRRAEQTRGYLLAAEILTELYVSRGCTERANELLGQFSVLSVLLFS